MLVDYERAWLALKVLVLDKRSHGQKDLLAAMARVEVESKLEEGAYPPPLSTPTYGRSRVTARNGDPLTPGGAHGTHKHTSSNGHSPVRDS